MLIGNPDVFKSWLTSILEPLCDADPAALAKYVYALVKKDKPLDDLREGMLDQLDVFLQHETKPFVDMLFKSLETHEYLKGVEANDIAPLDEEAVKDPQVTENHIEPVLEHETNGLPPLEERPVSPPPVRNRVVLTRPPPNSLPHTEQTLVKVVPTQLLLEEPMDLPRRRDRRELLREKEDRRRRRSRSWDRNNRRTRRIPFRDTSPNANNGNRRNDRRRATSRSPSPTIRGRTYRNRSPPPALLEPPLSRSRSRSPILLDHEREQRLRIPREMERDRMSRDRMSRDRDHRERLSRSRDRDRSRSPGTPIRDGLSNKHLNNNLMTRCRDFDEKGYCMRGDLCQWDHGIDPVVLEDPCRVLFPPAVPEYNPLAPDIYAHPYPPYLPPRELVPIPRVRDVPPPPAALPPTVPPVTHVNYNQPNNKKNFDYNRLGGAQRAQSGPNAINCSLEVKKVPRGMNDITHLNNHFGKFGKIVNIQVGFEGDPEAALITFSNHTEANVAYKSTEAVLNNRFIKVFWHNHESKQENVPPANGNSAFKQTEKPANQHPSSLNKVLINKDNMKATADNKANEEKIKEEVKKDLATKTINDKKSFSTLHKRAQALLETQLQQQRLLISRLEADNLTEVQRKELLSAVQSSQEAIEKLRKELMAYNNKALQAVQGESVASYMSRLQLSQARKPKTEAEAEKAILDAEMDIHNKQQEGQDVAELLKRLGELKKQKALQFPSHPTVRRPHPRNVRYPNNTRYVRNATSTSKVFVNQSVDHRPRALLISGFEEDEIDAVVKHFAQFGEIIGKEVNTAVPELILQFRVRAHAELAVTRAKHYNDRTLSINWITNNKPITPVTIPITAAAESASGETATGETARVVNGGEHTDAAKREDTEQVAAEPVEDTLLRFDEEEEEENEEDRSWRR